MPKQDTSTETKFDGEGQPIGPDVMPEPIDDEAPVEPAASSSEQAEAQPSAPKTEHRPKKKDRRDEIAQMYRALRDKQNAGEPAEPPSAGEDTADKTESVAVQPAPESTEPKSQDTQNSGQPSRSEQSQVDEIVLKIDGKEVRKPLTEVIALAQIGAASENRLDEAKRLLTEVKALHAQAVQPANPPAQPETGQTQTAQAPSQTEPHSTPAPANPPDGLKVDQDKLRAIAERLQVGDTEEGTQALAEYMQEVVAAAQTRQPNIDPNAVTGWVREAVLQMQSQAEADTALQKFAERYKPLVENQDLALTSMTVLTRELMKDLKTAGFRDEDLAANRHDTRTLAHWHRVARQTHRNLRSYDQLLEDVGQHMVRTYNLAIDHQQTQGSQPATHQQQPRTPPQSTQARMERKRALPSQPRTANVRAQIETPPRPKTREEIINEYRQARGFAPR